MRRLTAFSNVLMQRYLPDPFVFVLILTFVVFIGALLVTPSSPLEIVQYWGDGFWSLLAFGMQMVLVLVTGFVLASTPLVKKGLGKMASWSKSAPSAILLVTIVSLVASWVNWGFGLVIGALFAKELAKRVPKVDYPLLIASAYSGFVIWHAGFSGSIPLTIATEGHFAENLIGLIPTSETIFASYNLIILAVLFFLIPLLNVWMLPKEKDRVIVDTAKLTSSSAPSPSELSKRTPAERLEWSPWLSIIAGALGLIYLSIYFVDDGSLNLNIVNFLFLILGLLLHFRPMSFLHSVQEAVKGAGGIIVQFPFYAGIMGIMTSSGLAVWLSEVFVSISNETTFYMFAFFSAGIVNFFVPSGGGQWAVQAPIMLEAALQMNADVAKTSMAVAWGDAWTNMIQPFWALPALAIAGLRAKDIMGYCVVILMGSGIVISLGLLLL
ncbi:short-chain fatty acid transporter [Bacillus fonticola]|uniref:short-chain fatty acid transporter n=1 Tax=Bacillus fonticola TaxID=2728853 RepID=UPI001472D20A|nr:short-chain fatty acid transporter [Bacillus fonticola]